MKIKIPTTVSLAKRAGKVISGEDGVKNAIRFKKAALVILAEDAGTNTVKSVTDSCAYYNVKHITMGTKEELGHSIGNSFNAVIAICDAGFAESIEKAINNGGEVL